MEKLQTDFVIPQGVTTPCGILPAIFQTPHLEPDPVEWLKSSTQDKKLKAEEKIEAEHVAVKACGQCPLIAQCRAHFVGVDVYGVVGGQRKAEREKVGEASTVCYDPVEHYINTGEMLTMYEYIDSLVKGKKDNIPAVLAELDITPKELADIMKVNHVVSPSYHPEDVDLLVRKLIRGGISERLIVDRARVTPHKVRSLKSEHLWSREKKVENYFEKVHNTKVFRLSRATKIVYDQLSLARRGDLKTAHMSNMNTDVELLCECNEEFLTREEVFSAVEPHLTKNDKLRSVQKKRKFKTEEAKLVSGARRAVNHALLLSVQSGLVDSFIYTPCGREGCKKSASQLLTDGSRGGSVGVKVFQMKKKVANKWFTYRYKKLHTETVNTAG